MTRVWILWSTARCGRCTPTRRRLRWTRGSFGTPLHGKVTDVPGSRSARPKSDGFALPGHPARTGGHPEGLG